MLPIRAFLASTAIAIGALALSGPAFAIGSNFSGTPSCPKGKVYSQSKKSCVQAKSDATDDKSFADYAYYLAKQGRYQEALAMLDLMKNQHTAVALNYRGYVTRKLGRTEEGIGYYKQSVALDPKYPLVREYLGEAYVLQGKVDLAKEQLAEIKNICGTSCRVLRGPQPLHRNRPRELTSEVAI